MTEIVFYRIAVGIATDPTTQKVTEWGYVAWSFLGIAIPWQPSPAYTFTIHPDMQNPAEVARYPIQFNNQPLALPIVDRSALHLALSLPSPDPDKLQIIRKICPEARYVRVRSRRRAVPGPNAGDKSPRAVPGPNAGDKSPLRPDGATQSTTTK